MREIEVFKHETLEGINEHLRIMRQQYELNLEIISLSETQDCYTLFFHSTARIKKEGSLVHLIAEYDLENISFTQFHEELLLNLLYETNNRRNK